MNDQQSLWQRIQAAGRATGLNGGIRSYLRELREDMPDIDDKINDIGISHMDDEAAGRAEFIARAQYIVQKVRAEGGIIEGRDLRTADRLFGALVREAGHLEEAPGQLSKTGLEALQRAWKMEFNRRLAPDNVRTVSGRDDNELER